MTAVTRRPARTARTALLPLAVGGLLAAGLAVPANAAHEELVVTGLGQNGKLVTFLAGTGERLSQTKRAGGLLPGDTLVALDYRPSTGVLYGVATDGSEGRVSTLDPATAAATPLALVFPITGDVSIDVNPAADRLRVVSTDGDNYRLDVRPGASPAVFADGDLATADGSPFAVAGVAYTNNDNDPATPTTLFDVDALGDRLLKQDPPNAGTLGAVGRLTTDVGTDTGFDVYTEGPTNIALPSDRDADGTRVYTLLTTGSVNRTPTSPVLVQGTPVLDIAVDPAQ